MGCARPVRRLYIYKNLLLLRWVGLFTALQRLVWFEQAEEVPHEESLAVTDHAHVYIRRWFVLDFVACIPLDVFVSVVGWSNLPFLRINKLLRLGRLFWYLNIVRELLKERGVHVGTATMRLAVLSTSPCSVEALSKPVPCTM